MKSISIILLFITITSLSYAQKLELDMSAGTQFAKIAFHHSSAVDTDSDESYKNEGSYYNIGITGYINKKWRLRTEIGYVINNSFFSASYKYDEGFGEKNTTIITYLTNQKIHLGIFPEYRIDKSKISYYLHGGIFLARDISNTMSTLDRVLLPKSRMLAFKFNSGIIVGNKSIKLKLNAGFTWFGKSQLMNIYQPKISYKSINIGIGIVYLISNKDDIDSKS